MAARSYSEANTCPICGGACKGKRHDDPVDWEGDCPNCGNFHLDVDAECRLHGHDCKEMARVSHQIWRAQASNGAVRVDRDFVDVALEKPLPSPAHRLDLLLAYVGEEFYEIPSREFQKFNHELKAKIGAVSTSDIDYIVKAGQDRGWLIFSSGIGPHEWVKIQITMKGWQRFEEIRKGLAPSNLAFMAMQFDKVDKSSEDFFKNHLVREVRKTGIELECVNARHSPGSIDDKIRVDIRNCKFLIADLSHCNRGVYWEAGYAEGIGKTVFYICNADRIKPENVHFDLNHQNIIQWDSETQDEVARQIKDSIRRHFPELKRNDTPEHVGAEGTG